MYLVGQEGITLLKVTKFDEYRNHNNYSTLIPSQMWSTVLVHKVFHWLGCSCISKRLVPTRSRGVGVFYQRLWTIDIPFLAATLEKSLIIIIINNTGQSTFISWFREL